MLNSMESQRYVIFSDFDKAKFTLDDKAMNIQR